MTTKRKRRAEEPEHGTTPDFLEQRRSVLEEYVRAERAALLADPSIIDVQIDISRAEDIGRQEDVYLSVSSADIVTSRRKLGDTLTHGGDTFQTKYSKVQLPSIIEEMSADLLDSAFKARDIKESIRSQPKKEREAFGEVLRSAAIAKLFERARTVDLPVKRIAELRQREERLKNTSLNIFLLAALTFFVSLVAAAVLVYIWNSDSARGAWSVLPAIDWVSADTARTWSMIMVVIALAAGVAVGLDFVWDERLLQSAESTEMRNLETQVESTLLRDVEFAMRREISRMAMLESKELVESRLLLLETGYAPALVEMERPEGFQESRTFREIRTLIDDHETIAIGIAGPRGVGKSTIMHQLAISASEETIGIYLPVPVAYGPTEFLRVLFASTAERIIEEETPELDRGTLNDIRTRAHRTKTRQSRPLAWIAVTFLGLGLFLLLFGGVTVALTSISVPLAAAPAIMAIGAGLLVWSALLQKKAGKKAPRAHDLIKESYAVLDRLRWARKLSSTSTVGVGLGSGSRMDESAGMEFLEEKMHHAEMVRAFREYLELISRSYRVIISIDELDKIESSEEALHFVSNIKDLFHVRGTYFLVSVSLEALENFALRGMILRDVIDSSFDVVVEVERLDPDASVAILEGRAGAFPRPVALLCHSLSGGLPRDLVRYARRCVLLRRRYDRAIEIQPLASRLVVEDAVETLRVAAMRLRSTDLSATARFLVDMAINLAGRDLRVTGEPDASRVRQTADLLEDYVKTDEAATRTGEAAQLGGAVEVSQPGHPTQSDVLARLISYLRFLDRVWTFYGRTDTDALIASFSNRTEANKIASDLAAERALIELE